MAWLNTLSALALLLATVSAQCRTDENPYCAGNDDFEAICCTYPNVCYWADRQGTPACCPAGQVCIDRNGFQITPQSQYTTAVPAPAPAPEPEPEPKTVYVTASSKYPPVQTITQHTQSQPTQQPRQSTVVVTSEAQTGPIEGIGSTVVATGSSVINVFEGAAPTVRPAQCAVPMPVAGALALAAWHLV